MSALKILGIPCWVFPLLAGFTWFVTLLSLITSWVIKGSKHYPEMWPIQQLPYISNIGASQWGQPLFITGCVITAALFSVTFISERWLRHQGRLIHSQSKWATFFWNAAALLTAIGTCAQILLTVFCIRRHAYTHYSMVALFALAYIFAAAFICAEKKHLCNRFPTNRVLRSSLWIKLFFIIIEIILVIVGSVTMYERMYRTSIVIEWIAALFFTFYVSSFAVDFFAIPARNEKDDGVQLLGTPWDEEAAISQPTKLYTISNKRCTIVSEIAVTAG